MGFDGSIINAQSPIARAIQNDAIGGVILFDYHFQTERFDKNIHNPTQVRELNHTLHRLNTNARMTAQQPSLPLIISVDYEGGHVNRLKESYGFPSTISAAKAAQCTEDDAYKAAESMAETLKSLGFNLDFAPVVDINVDPNNPIIGKLDRSFSADPAQVSQYAKAFAEAFAKHHVQCAYKHFPGHGSAQQDSHMGFVDVTETWQDYELAPYQALHNEPACQMVMTAHIVNRHLDPSGRPATLSQPILTGILRQKLAFQGIIITDDMQMKAITDHYAMDEAITLAINAGADMLIFGNQLSPSPEDPKTIIDTIEKQVLKGHISEEKIHAAYANIEKFKRLL